MDYLLDSDVIVDHIRGVRAIPEFVAIRRLDDFDLFIAASALVNKLTLMQH